MKKKSIYKESLNLPETRFPMRANLAEKELKQLSDWEDAALYAELQKKPAPKGQYILHDGPPYANGHIHIGHALNKILKDIIIKSKTMQGYHAPYVPGWDCHGLPIEHQVLKKLGSKKREMSKNEIRKKCREYAQRFVEIQKEEFKRLGVSGDWDHPYLTLTADYEAAIVREFAKVFATGGVYKGKKPVLWCSFDETALAEAEVEYADKVSPSIYVKFQIQDFKEAKGHFPEGSEQSTAFVIWTTTPWTLVANQAISLHPKFIYRRVKTPSGELIIAEDLVAETLQNIGLDPASCEVIGAPLSGNELEGIICRHPWLDRSVPVILGEHVTLEQGTGCVHTAPGHGQEDYEVGLKYQLEVYAPVDNRGRFTEEAGQFSGEKVNNANEAIIDKLKTEGTLLHVGEIEHSYPHCWRCKRPVIFRATEQWFISMAENHLRDRALATIENDVTWIPKWGKERILGMIKNRPDWCISRQRVWGVPIVAFSCLDCEETFTSEKIINHVADLMAEQGGSDLWFEASAETLLPQGTSCPKCNGSNFKQEQDILDVWFESGVSHAAVLKARPALSWPADLYLEGSDQHRGWFHSTLLASLMTDGKAPYKAVLTHGFVVDGSGHKMSKSVGNVVAPQEVIKKHGADILRLWVAACDFREDIRISQDLLTQLIESYRKIRNTCRFLLGNLSDYSREQAPSLGTDFLDIDRWALDRLHLLNQKVQEAYDDSSFHLVVQALTNFCTVDLSSFYLDILKDRLYTAPKNSPERRAAQEVMRTILSSLIRLMAPILPFTAEEIWRHLSEDFKNESSVHLSNFPKIQGSNAERSARWEKLIQVREAVARVSETARRERKIGNSLEARVILSAKTELYTLLKAYESFLPSLFIVSQVDLNQEAIDASQVQESSGIETDESSETWVFSEFDAELALSIRVVLADGNKCERCWVYQEDVGVDEVHPTLCRRCTDVMSLEGVDV